jgi:hypothetical protein
MVQAAKALTYPCAGRNLENASRDERGQAVGVWYRLPHSFEEKFRGEFPEADFTTSEATAPKKLAHRYKREIDRAFEALGGSPPPTTRLSLTLLGMRQAIHRIERYPESHRAETMRQRAVLLCMKDILKRYTKVLDEWFYQAAPEELLTLLLSVPQDKAEQLISYLKYKQAETSVLNS